MGAPMAPAAHRTLVAQALLALVGVAAPARGAPPAAVRVIAAGCPGAGEVVAALAPLLPSTLASAGAGVPGAVELRVIDRGASYRVEVAGAARDFPDEARRCSDRARAAAVFATLTLDPPALAAPPTPPTPSAPPSPTVPPAPTAPAPPIAFAAPAPVARERGGGAGRWLRALRVELELGGRFEVAPPAGSSTVLLDGGGALHLAVGTAHLALVVGGAGLAPASFRPPGLAAGSARLLRAPFDLDLRASLRRSRIELSVEAGLAITVLAASGEGFATNLGQTIADVGVHAGLLVRVWLGGRLAPYFALDALGSPRSYPLVASGAVVDSTPRLWIGATLGLAIKLH